MEIACGFVGILLCYCKSFKLMVRCRDNANLLCDCDVYDSRKFQSEEYRWKLIVCVVKRQIVRRIARFGNVNHVLELLETLLAM